MKKTLYAIMRDVSEDLGEGYSSNSYGKFLGLVTDFTTARNVIEYFVDKEIGEDNHGFEFCEDCLKDYCGDCEYFNHAKVDDDNWNRISIEHNDSYKKYIHYYFKKIEIDL